MSGPAKTQAELCSLKQCFPSLRCKDGDGNWFTVLCDYCETRDQLRSTDPSEIPELTSEHTIFAKSMDWIERLVLGFLETVEPSPDMTIATPEAALHWMIEVTGFVILLALFESHTTYMIMLRAAPAFCNGDGQRWLTYAHRLDSTVIPRYLLENNSLEESFNYARRRLDGDEYDRKLVDIWRRELIPLSEKSAVWGDKMHALHEMVQDFKDIKSPADFPDNWDSRMAEIFDAIDSRYKW